MAMIYCPDCGRQLSNRAVTCLNCGCPIAQIVSSGGVKCPRCTSTNLYITLEQLVVKTKTRGMGCLWSLFRLILIFCTCGLWLLIGPRVATSKTEFINNKVAICQNCGYKWNL